MLLLKIYVFEKKLTFLKNSVFLKIPYFSKNSVFQKFRIFQKVNFQCLLYGSLILVVFHRVANGGIP